MFATGQPLHGDEAHRKGAQEKEVTKLVEEWGKRIGIEPNSVLEIKGREHNRY